MTIWWSMLKQPDDGRKRLQRFWRPTAVSWEHWPAQTKKNPISSHFSIYKKIHATYHLAKVRFLYLVFSPWRMKIIGEIWLAFMRPPLSCVFTTNFILQALWTLRTKTLLRPQTGLYICNFLMQWPGSFLFCTKKWFLLIKTTKE